MRAAPRGPAVHRPMLRPRGWPMWDLPPVTRLLIVVMTSAAVTWTLAAVWRSSFAGHELVLFAVLLAACAVSVEATKRVPEPAGVNANDMLGAWWIAMTVLLPPVYSLLAPAVLMALTQWRVQRIAVYKRAYSAAAVGVAHAVASVTFHAFPGRWTDWHQLTVHPIPLVLAVIAAAAVAKALNTGLIGVAVKSADPEARWRAVFFVDHGMLEITELCAGVLIAVLTGLTQVLVLVALLPVLLLQRGLLYAQLNAAARTEAKTGLLNAVSWEREAAAALSSARRRGQPVAVLLVDIDHFKRVNDTHGHLVGDDVLREVAGVLRAQVRNAHDLVCRFGGEEFAVLLPGLDVDGARRAAERLRREVAELVTPTPEHGPVRVTVSVGVTVTDEVNAPEANVSELLAGADLGLYRAKAEGRNRVRLLTPRTAAGPVRAPGGGQGAGERESRMPPRLS